MAVLLAAFAMSPARAENVPFTDGFSGISADAAGTTTDPIAGTIWGTSGGSVDAVNNDATCRGGSGDCILLNGSLDAAGSRFYTFGTSPTGTFPLVAGQQYQMTAYIKAASGSNDRVTFGFVDAANIATIFSSMDTGAAQLSSSFTLYTLLFTPTVAQTSVRLFFKDYSSSNDAYIDDVSLTTVPLPASAWLLLSGLLALGIMARRQRDLFSSTAA